MPETYFPAALLASNNPHWYRREEIWKTQEKMERWREKERERQKECLQYVHERDKEKRERQNRGRKRREMERRQRERGEKESLAGMLESSACQHHQLFLPQQGKPIEPLLHRAPSIQGLDSAGNTSPSTSSYWLFQRQHWALMKLHHLSLAAHMAHQCTCPLQSSIHLHGRSLSV